jgi:hypothetical protein
VGRFQVGGQKVAQNRQRVGHRALIGLKFQVVERRFESLDEVLIWVDRNQLGRRNLTDSQRTEVIGRIYNTLKQNPVLNLKQFQSGENGEGTEDREVNLTSRKGSDATARAVAKATGVSEKTVRNAGKFAEAVAASTNFQCHSATWT